jgi:hypothetical protein
VNLPYVINTKWILYRGPQSGVKNEVRFAPINAESRLVRIMPNIKNNNSHNSPHDLGKLWNIISVKGSDKPGNKGALWANTAGYNVDQFVN